MTTELIRRARELRQRQTKAESLLWSVLRAKRLCNKKFRRQHPVNPFVADFACCELALIVEIDGGYHDYQCEDDARRQNFLEAQGWRVENSHEHPSSLSSPCISSYRAFSPNDGFGKANLR